MTQTANDQDNFFERIPILVILGLLVFLIFARTGESVHGQMTKLGEFLWDDYFTLRTEVSTPSCNPDPDIEARLDQLEQKAAAEADDLLGEDFDRNAARQSLENQSRLCQQEHALAEQYQSRVTPQVVLFREIEHKFSQASIFATAQQQLFLVLLLFFSAGVATWRRHHIAFRPMMSVLDHRISTTLQLLANGSLAVSAWVFRDTTFSSWVRESAEITSSARISPSIWWRGSTLREANGMTAMVGSSACCSTPERSITGPGPGGPSR